MNVLLYNLKKNKLKTVDYTIYIINNLDHGNNKDYDIFKDYILFAVYRTDEELKELFCKLKQVTEKYKQAVKDYEQNNISDTGDNH